MRHTYTTTEKCPKCNSEIIMFGYCCTNKHDLVCTKCDYKKEIDYSKFEKKAKKKGEYVGGLTFLNGESVESTYSKWLKQFGAEHSGMFEIGFVGKRQAFEKPIVIGEKREKNEQ